MPYIVKRVFPTPVQIDVNDILNDIFNQQVKQRHVTDGATLTRFVKELPQEMIRNVDVYHLINVLADFVNRHHKLFEADRKSLYREFSIPKKSGGLRKIDAPNDELKEAQRELKFILESEFGMLYHTAAYAYVRGRNTIGAVRRHQANESRGFLKTDFSGVFPSTTLEFTMKMLGMIYPFCEVVKVPEGKDILEKALSLGFLDGGLPQGTPLSPSLTNAIMIPLDHYLARHFGDKKMVYTRYADDILVSSKYEFKYRDEVAFINKIVKEFGAPYTIKPEKTRYGSSSGRNWNLGVMLNKDNKITIGHKRKKEFKAMLNNYTLDFKNGIRWDIGDVQEMVGLISYYKMVEEEYIKHVIIKHNEKNHCNVMKIIKADLGSRHTV